jgi:uncharacterized BrkB/YihY/UPF0761 family membrane protein
MNLRNGYQMIRAAASDFLDDNAMTLTASLAFYSALSLAQLLPDQNPQTPGAK